MIGKHVLVWDNNRPMHTVFYGKVLTANGRSITLIDAHEIYHSGEIRHADLATMGPQKDTKVSSKLSEIIILKVTRLIVCSELAVDEWKDWIILNNS